MIKRFADARSGGDESRAGLRVIMVFAAILTATVFLAQGALAGGFALSGVGSKAINMGGAFRGLADDWSAAYWNPAGLTQMEKSEFTGMLVAINARPEFIPNMYPHNLDVGYRNGLARYPNDKTHFLPDFSGFMKLEGIENFTVGLAVYVPYGLGSEWDLFNPQGLAHSYPWYDHQADLQVIDFHPTVAKSFMDNHLSLGLGISMMYGDVTFKRTFLKSSGLPIPHQNLIIDSEMNGSGWGYGANMGLLYKFSDKLQMGISGRTSTTMKLEGSAKQELYTFADTDLRDILLAQSITRADSLRVMFLFATDNHKANPSAASDFKTPADIGFGLAFKPSERLTFTGDVAYTMWSALDSILLEFNGTDPSGAPAQNSAILLDWENTLRFSLGAEYWLAKPLALRLGYYFDPSPAPDETFTPLIPDLGDKNSFNIGAALQFSSLELSYNFEYLAFKDRNVTSFSDVNDDGIYDNYPGSYKEKLYASHMSVTYRF